MLQESSPIVAGDGSVFHFVFSPPTSNNQRTINCSDDLQRNLTLGIVELRCRKYFLCQQILDVLFSLLIGIKMVCAPEEEEQMIKNRIFGIILFIFRRQFIYCSSNFFAFFFRPWFCCAYMNFFFHLTVSDDDDDRFCHNLQW